MNISNHYWYFKSALTPRFCDEVIKYANNQKEVMARTGGYGEKKLKKTRNIRFKKKKKL